MDPRQSDKASGWAWAALAALAVTTAGCPGRLQDPERFLVSCPATTNVETDIFQGTCGTTSCHNSTANAGGLDLVSPNVASRLINKQSATCPGHVLIASPDSGFMFDKLLSTEACGSPMPLGKPALTNSEIFCITQWAAAHADGG